MIFSIARETFKTVCSSNNLPVILPPKGIPSILPNGNVNDGRPAKLPNAKKFSAIKYSSDNLSNCLSNLGAVVGEDGKTISNTKQITVRKVSVESVSLNKSVAEISFGRTLQLTATVAPSNATNKNVSWKSSNTSVATVSSTGTVMAVGKGTAVITCSARDGSGVKSTCRITVTLPAPAPAPTRSSDDTGGSGGDSGGGSGGGNSGSGGGSGDSGSGGGYVWISATGSKYHNKNNCGTMNPGKASKVTLEEARRRGLDPCQKCFP